MYSNSSESDDITLNKVSFGSIIKANEENYSERKLITMKNHEGDVV